MLAILMIIILVIIVITAVIIMLIQIGGWGNRRYAKRMIRFGEYLLCISACLFYIVNTSILGEFSNSDAYVIESLKEIALQVDKIERKSNAAQLPAYERVDTEPTLSKISDIEKRVESSDIQVNFANKLIGSISLCGTILIFSGKLIKQRDEESE